MKRGDILEGTVIKLYFPNKGVVRTPEGDELRVKGVLPGQRVQIRVKKSSHAKAQAQLIQVLEKSELESRQEVCPHFGICGGCAYQSIPYEKQLVLKENALKDLFIPVLGENSFLKVWEGIKRSPQETAYRNKMEFTFGDTCKDGPLALGMHKKGSFYDIVSVENCDIVDEDFRQILKTTLAFFKENQVTYFHRMHHKGYLRHLLVRKAKKTGEILIDLITTTQNPYAEDSTEDKLAVSELLRLWQETLLQQEYQGTITGILHTKNDSLADAVIDEGTEILYGQDFFYEELLGLTFRISPFSFFQTNSLGAEVLYETARQFILQNQKDVLSGKEVFDLYSGTGTIAQILSPVCREVIGVEIVSEAVEAAVSNAKQNHLTNCHFIAGDVLKVLDEIDSNPDYIILDPPRDGIHPKAIEKIIQYGVEQMVYISCKPTSLARDLEIFMAHGYRVERMAGVDMFPRTVHVETVVLMSRVEGK